MTKSPPEPAVAMQRSSVGLQREPLFQVDNFFMNFEDLLDGIR